MRECCREVQQDEEKEMSMGSGRLVPGTQLKRAQKLGCAELRCELEMRKQCVHYRVFFWVHMAGEVGR